MKPRTMQAAPPTPEWTALVKHLQTCTECRTGGPCEMGRELLDANKASRRSGSVPPARGRGGQ